MILCGGDALIDMLPARTAAGEAACVPRPGGAVFNTALALGRLGVPAGFLCALSRDPFGALLAEALAAAGVDTALCPRVDRPTTLAFVTLTDGQARYDFHDENTALRSMTPDEMPVLPDPVTTLFLGGISLAGEPCGAAFEALCGRAADRVVMLDPNIRPGFVRDEGAYRARLDRLFARADIVKLSDEDLGWLMPGIDTAQAATTLLGRGAALVAVTRGAAGAEVWHAGGRLALPASPVRVVDTVGAGDTFNAGLLAGLFDADVLNRRALRALPADILHSALSLAIRAAGITASRAGAEPPWRQDLG